MRTPLLRPVALAVALAAPLPAAEAAKPLRLAFRTPVEVPEEGLSLRLFRGAEAKGLPTPQIHLYRDTQGGRYECYDPRELWLATQFRGRWEDPDGNAVTLAAPSSYLPRGFERPHVERADYERAAARAPGSPSTPQELARWAEDALDAKLEGEPRPLAASGARLQQVVALRFAGAPVRLGYAFRVRPNPFGVDPNRWFVALVELRGDVSADEAARLLETEFVPAIGTVARRVPAQAAASARFQNRDVAAAPAAGRSAEFEASRQAVVNSIKGRKGWWFAETPNYVFVSDLSGAKAATLREVQGDLESLRAAYARLVAPRKPVTAVSVVRAFENGGEYQQYVGPEMQWSGGAWIASRKELVIRPLDGGTPRDRREWLTGTVYHEAFHQYVSYALDFYQPAAWFNEGHAALFEGADVRDGKVALDEVEHYARRIDELGRGGLAGARRVFALSYDGFYLRSGGAEARQDHYALAWAIAYYLRKGVPSGGGPAAYAAIPDRYVEALWTSRDPAQATQAALAGVDPAAFERDLAEFWRSGAKRGAARRFDLFKDLKPDSAAADPGRPAAPAR